MFTLNREKTFYNYYKNNFKLSRRLTDSILKYMDINKIDNLEEKSFNLKIGEKYLLLFNHYNDNSLYKIFDTKYHYVILSNNTEKWNKLFTLDIFNGIFMNTSNINYTKINNYIENIDKSRNILIIDCNYLDIKKLNINNLTIFTIFSSSSITTKPEFYNKILIKLEPWTLCWLNGPILFDNKLRKEFSKFLLEENMKGNNDFLMINNESKENFKLCYIK